MTATIESHETGGGRNPAEAGYKLVVLLPAPLEMSTGRFADAWDDLDHRSPASAPGLIRYVFNEPMAEPPPIANAGHPPFVAAAETWWDRKNSAADWVVSASFRNEWLPPRLELLGRRPTAVGGIPQLIWEAPEQPGPDAVTVFTLPVASQRLRFQEFVDHWTGPHARLALSSPGVEHRLLRLEDTPAPKPATTQLEHGRYDGVGTLTFASLDALRAEFDSDYYRSELAPDELRFTTPTASHALLTRERRH
jgi:hypothetical protein